MFIYIGVEVIGLVLLIYCIFYIVSLKLSIELERVSSYECGFDLNSKTRVSFSYRFFLIAILFLIFDVEIALILPVPYFSLGNGGVFLSFILILVVGLLFEYFIGVLNWI
jgi:NADH-ubiquinone oxidoreductase chain 3